MSVRTLLLIHTSLFGVQLRMTTKLMYLMTAYYMYTSNGGFTANDIPFYKSKVGYPDYILQSLQLIVHTDVKITKRYYHMY